ncbi:zinc finger protein 184-like [Coregonus clupeaformis]|uniref:zinc finger protein 184-like n=1 Tax=Coregonus clupeaformis TaxID=59861 RepID=UPI001BE00604|nr:zinc finger protein 184-like [Coregonus clupeaformis]
MDPGNMPLGLETQTDLSRGDWNRYSSSVYSEGCVDKKEEGLVVDVVTVKVEGDIPSTWNTDSHLEDGLSQDIDFMESLETNPNVETHSPLHAFRDRDPVSMPMGHFDSHGRVLFDQVLNSNDRARAQVQGGGATSGDSKKKKGSSAYFVTKASAASRRCFHQWFHTAVKLFSCTQCHMHFAQSGNLKRHQRVHTREKSYSGPQCEKRFSNQHHLKMHLKVHKGERPFACTHCVKRFPEWSYLRIHQQKKPFHSVVSDV